MPLSPKDVEQKTFNASFRGYAEDEVDGFLEEVIASVEEYQQMVRQRDAQIAELEAGLVMAPVAPPKKDAAAEPEPTSELPEPGPEVPRIADETAVSRALIVAQRTADQLVEDANSEADEIIEAAKHRSAEIIEAESAHRRALMDGYRRLRSELAQLRGRMTDSFATTETTFKSLESEVDEFLSRDQQFDRVENPSEIGELGEEAEAAQGDVPDSDTVEEDTPDEAPDPPERRPWERG
jgi:cell division initiation protein